MQLWHIKCGDISVGKCEHQPPVPKRLRGDNPAAAANPQIVESRQHLHGNKIKHTSKLCKTSTGKIEFKLLDSCDLCGERNKTSQVISALDARILVLLKKCWVQRCIQSCTCSLLASCVSVMPPCYETLRNIGGVSMAIHVKRSGSFNHTKAILLGDEFCPSAKEMVQ